MAKPAPTTKAQLSGHKFLWRRVEHGLVLGDIRMLHDPLATRRRAVIFGMIIVVMLSAGAGLFAWFSPAPDPGEARLVRAGEEYFVRVGEVFHPVPNIASARLILGEPVEPASMGRQLLSTQTLGAQLGISDAPNFLAPASDQTTAAWSACISRPEPASDFGYVIDSDSYPVEVILSAEQPGRLFGPQLAALVQVMDPADEDSSITWLITADGRQPTTLDGPTWQVPAQWLAAVPLSSEPQPRAKDIQWIAPSEQWLCTGARGMTVATDQATIRLPGSSVATAMVPLPAGGVGVQTDHGYSVISATGRRHPSTLADLQALGTGVHHRSEWAIISLLPEGSALRAGEALTPVP